MKKQMENSINKIAVLLLFAVLPACGDKANTTQVSTAADNEKDVAKTATGKGKSTIGNVVIKLNGKTYELELAKCYSQKSVYLINTKKDKNYLKAPFFTSQGSKGKGFSASYSFTPEGSEMHGGTKYSGEMPFDQFKNNEIIFKGEAKSFNPGDGITAIRGTEHIEFIATCNE